ncbi:hypothetical protein RRG08_041658 [Elysia crispata]|uniref:Uncharacterized protein n=1 Tax=Elysia crispata TaxID=231223 RepID=A0AAE0YB10_9GAST|nr:hypothetical protein RRG08_041658 [Elysia crispata]
MGKVLPRNICNLLYDRFVLGLSVEQHKDYRSAKLTVEVKSEVIAEQNKHLMSVTAERSFYQSCVVLKRTAEARGITMLEPSPSCSKSVSFRYSFDYAQQVHLPSNPLHCPLQPGPIYFLILASAEYSMSAVKPSPSKSISQLMRACVVGKVAMT